MITAGKQQTETITVKIPQCFIEDHRDRDLIVDAHDNAVEFDSIIVRRLKKHYIVTLTRRQAAELLSDADYYIELGVDGLGSECLGLVSSARATRNALLKAGA